MNDSFLQIVVTSPGDIPDEVEKCCQLLESGAADYIHFRKPSWSMDKTFNWLGAVPDNLLKRMTLHDHFEIAGRLPIGGLHLNSRNMILPSLFEGRVSRSCHSLDEVCCAGSCDYVTLSPIFDSISKQGYLGAIFPERELSGLSEDKRLVALGGVEPKVFKLLSEIGFVGGAMLGYVWENPQGKSFHEIVDTLKASRAMMAEEALKTN